MQSVSKGAPSRTPPPPHGRHQWAADPLGTNIPFGNIENEHADR
jgi:hypothetical protein